MARMTARITVLFLAGVLLNQPLQAQTKSPDFDGSGTVDLDDFFLFAAAFGSTKPTALTNPLREIASP